MIIEAAGSGNNNMWFFSQGFKLSVHGGAANDDGGTQPQRPAENPYSFLVYSTKASDVETVIVEGRVVVRDGRVLTLDAAEVVKEAARHRRRLADLAAVAAGS